MSGGWDSTSVFASGRSSLRRENHTHQRLLPISMTYEADDLGNEVAHIRAVAELWDSPVRWIDAEQIPLFGDGARAQVRDDPMPQPFESQVRTMAQVTRELGSRVALDGFGGDHIFDVGSASIVADHLFYGRWRALLESYRRWGASNREFVRSCLLLHLSPGSLEWIGAIRGRRVRGYWDRTIPTWVIASPDVVRELTPALERLPGEGAAEYASRLGIHDPLISRAVSWNHLFGLDEGIHIRSPLFDNRVIALSVPRPLSDRGGGGDSKRLLRRAMSGMIPDSVLAPRARKTGTPVGYFGRQLRASLSSEVDKYFRSGQSQLERMGLLDRSVLESAVREYSTSGLHGLGAILHRTLETERWLASRS
jgi:asparagine synthase (glutamine-hydrolysing)